MYLTFPMPHNKSVPRNKHVRLLRQAHRRGACTLTPRAWAQRPDCPKSPVLSGWAAEAVFAPGMVGHGRFRSHTSLQCCGSGEHVARCVRTLRASVLGPEWRVLPVPSHPQTGPGPQRRTPTTPRDREIAAPLTPTWHSASRATTMPTSVQLVHKPWRPRLLSGSHRQADASAVPQCC